MKKRLLAALVCAMLLVTLLPHTALADSGNDTLYYNQADSTLRIGGTAGAEYTDGKGDTWIGSGTTLTLKGFNFTTTARTALRVSSGTTLELIGVNTVTSTYSEDEYNSIGISCSGTLKFVGDGTLIATCGGTNQEHGHYGIYAKNGIEVNGSCSITGRAGTNDSRTTYNYGVSMDGGTITVSSGSLTGIAAAATDYSYGVHAPNTDIVVSNNGSITGVSGAAGNDSFGMHSKQITVDSGSLVGIGGSATNSSYGIGVAYNNGSINLNAGAIVLAKGYSAALSKSPVLGQVTAVASESYDGSNVEPYNATNDAQNYVYKYFRTLATIPALQLTVSPQNSFLLGQAPSDETATIASALSGFNAKRNFDSATMDGAAIDLGLVGRSGGQGSVSNGDGSIVIRLNKAYLDTLTVGTHTLSVKLAGVYTGESVETQITVKKPAKTADAEPSYTQYQIVKGQNGVWSNGGANGLGFTADVDYAKFTGVYVDGIYISRDNYIAQSGSTIVTLKDSYLKTLSAGLHTLRVGFIDGYAETTFTVNGYTDIPKTGDNSMLPLWLGIALIAGAGLTAGLARRRRQNG